MIGSSTQQTNATTVAQPWAQAQPGLNQILGASSNWLNNAGNLQYFNQGSTAATLDPSQSAGIAGGEAIAGQGTNPAVGGANSLEADILSGKYLNAGNPNQNALDQSITNATLPALNATFSQAGRTGSGLNQFNVASGLGQALAAPHYQNYQYEQGLQQQAAGQAPGLAQAQYIAPEQMYGFGALQQQQQQQQLNAGFNAWQWNQMAPYMAAQQSAGLTTPIAGLGSTSNTNQTVQTTPNWFTTALGALGTGARLASSLPSGNFT